MISPAEPPINVIAPHFPSSYAPLVERISERIDAFAHSFFIWPEFNNSDIDTSEFTNPLESDQALNKARDELDVSSTLHHGPRHLETHRVL